MSKWRTDLGAWPTDGTDFDVIVTKTDGSRWRLCDVSVLRGVVVAFFRDSPSPVEYEYFEGSARVTHWAEIEMPDA